VDCTETAAQGPKGYLVKGHIDVYWVEMSNERKTWAINAKKRFALMGITGTITKNKTAGSNKEFLLYQSQDIQQRKTRGNNVGLQVEDRLLQVIKKPDQEEMYLRITAKGLIGGKN